MSDSTTSGVGGRPHPGQATSVDELAGCLRELRAWSGVSYRELHRRLVRLRRSRGVAEEPAYATVYRCLQPGRSRLDIELVADIVAVLTDDESEPSRWRQAYARISGETAAPSYTAVFDILPDDVGDFIGRDEELAALTEGDARILAIEGMAGVGKTTLAVRAARRLVETHPVDVVLSVNLAGYEAERAPVEPMAVLDGFLRTLGEPGPRIQTLGMAERTARYRELLADRRTLVLLDNAATAKQVEPLLPDDPSTLTLVTSRHRVVEHPTARHVTLDVFPSDQAIDLLRRRAGKAVDQASDVAAQIVEEVGRLPLAVAIVASRIETSPGWTLDDHLEHLAERRESLRLDPGVELAFATSYKTLPPSLKRLLRLLALHPGRDCDTYAAAALADTDLDLTRRQLADLADARLVGARNGDRFELHDLVRVFALNRAHEDDPPSARRAALTRLLDHYRWAATVAMDLYAPEERHRRPHVSEPDTATPVPADRSASVAWLDAERPNLVAAGAHAANHGWADHSSDLAAILGRYLIITARYDDASTLQSHASRAAHGSRKAATLKDLATARWHQGYRSEAKALLHQALEIAREAGDQSMESRVLTNLGNVYEHTGQFDEAVRSRVGAIKLHVELADAVGEGRARQNLGNTYRAQGRHHEALDQLERTLEIARSIGDTTSEVYSLENLGRLLNNLGRHEKAKEHELEALAIARQLGERVAEADSLTGLGVACTRMGDLEAGADYLQHALSIASDLGSHIGEIYARNELSETRRLQGDLASAKIHAQEALRIAARYDDLNSQAIAHDRLAKSYLALGETTPARLHWESALQVFERLGTPAAADVRRQLDEMGRAGRPEGTSHQQDV
jgi:tetratricopeptide (TPR) repeat protein